MNYIVDKKKVGAYLKKISERKSISLKQTIWQGMSENDGMH